MPMSACLLRRRGEPKLAASPHISWLAGCAGRDHVALSCPEQDNKLLRRVRRGQGMCAYCDVVTDQNTKPSLSKTSCSGG